MDCQTDDCDGMSNNVLKIEFENNTITIKLCDKHRVLYERCEFMENSTCSDQSHA